MEIERAERGPDQEHAQGEAEIADAVDQKGLLAGGGRLGLLEPEADQQVAAHPTASQNTYSSTKLLTETSIVIENTNSDT